MNPIEKINGPCIILAGAGTGKTHTIVEKVRYLIEKNIYEPEKIICITFSNEAANNLSLRIEKAVSILGKQKKPIVRTFHGFSADLLRLHADKAEISANFKILDTDQAKVILHRNLRVPAGNCHRYISTIGIAKDIGTKINEFQDYLSDKLKLFEGTDLERDIELLNIRLQTLYLKDKDGSKKEIIEHITKIRYLIDLKKFINAWNAYEKIKKKRDYQDYSDLSLNALKLLENYPEIAGNYSYIIVDEFQDTNKLQLDFIIKLAVNKNITVVGDANQSIYRFRGAYRENLNLFKEAFKVDAGDVFNLSKSYRSTNKVLRTAHKLVLHNYSDPNDCILVENSRNEEGDYPEIYELKDAREEARKVVELVKRESDKGNDLEEICIMFRTHQQGRIIRKALEQAEIPYVAVSKAPLTKQKSIKIAIDFMSIIDKLNRNGRGGEQEWWDLVYQIGFLPNDLIKIGKAIKDFSKLNKEYENTLSVYLMKNLDKLELSEKGKVASRILLEKIKKMLSSSHKPISKIIKEIYSIAGLVNEQKTKHEKEAMLNLNKFYELAEMHEELYDSDLNNFLYYLEILGSLGIEIEASSLEDKGVRMMTSHSTKGLEFDVVIATNFAQGRFPLERYSANSLIPTELIPEVKSNVKNMSDEQKEDFIKDYEKAHQLMEERRLAYVSFTRARKKLIITFADKYGNKKSYPSQFLYEINYKNNSDIIFKFDNDEKYSESGIYVKTRLNFFNIAHSKENKTLSALLEEDREIKSDEHRKLSPSALLLFEECQKQFEYKYVYNMPERKVISWDVMRLGSFVHLVLQKGVSSGLKSVDEFLSLAKVMSLQEDWESIELDDSEILIKVFFERNKGKYNDKSKTEEYLTLKLAGIDFIGYADRIDFSEKGIEIIDYKTGKSAVPKKDRNFQLGFYALAARSKYGKIRKVVLDMLRQEKPLEFIIDDEGNAVCENSSYIDGFNIYDVELELIDTAKAIQKAYDKGFMPCPLEKNCEFCNEYIYGL